MFKKIFYFQFIFGLLFTTTLYSQSLHLSVIGANETETKTIDSLNYRKQFSDISSLQNELSIIKKNLNTIGFLESNLTDLEKTNDSIYLAKFNLNNRYKNFIIHYKGVVDKTILKLVSEHITEDYFIVSIENLEETLQLLNTELSNRGNPFSILQLDNIAKSSNNNFTADLVILNKTKRKVDNILIKGYEKFPKGFVKHYLRIKPKQEFNLSKIKQKTETLSNLQFANQIKDPEVLFTKDSTILYIYIEKNKSNMFDGFLGFGTNTETNKLEFNGYLNLNLTNNLNYGESLKLKYKSDESDQKTFDINVNLPFIFNSPLDVELGLNIFKKDSTFITISQTARLGYQIDSKNQLSLGINSINSSDLLNINSTIINDFKSTNYNINYKHIKKQNYDNLFPLNFLFDITAGFGKRKYDAVNDSQNKFALNTFKIFNLNYKNSLYLNLDSALLTSNSYLENELFRFGGINSIRGFEENSLLADLYTVLNTEYRYRVSNSLYIHSIIDVAYFENNNTLTKEKLFGFGFGFGLLTKAGLFKFNYSNGESENQKFKFSDSKIHISLSALF